MPPKCTLKFITNHELIYFNSFEGASKKVEKNKNKNRGHILCKNAGEFHSRFMANTFYKDSIHLYFVTYASFFQPSY